MQKKCHDQLYNLIWAIIQHNCSHAAKHKIDRGLTPCNNDKIQHWIRLISFFSFMQRESFCKISSQMSDVLDPMLSRDLISCFIIILVWKQIWPQIRRTISREYPTDNNDTNNDADNTNNDDNNRKFMIRQTHFDFCQITSNLNKKVLLRKSKRNTDCGVSSTPSAVLSLDGGYPIPRWGYPISGYLHLDLARVPPSHLDLARVPPSGLGRGTPHLNRQTPVKT